MTWEKTVAYCHILQISECTVDSPGLIWGSSSRVQNVCRRLPIFLECSSLPSSTVLQNKIFLEIFPEIFIEIFLEIFLKCSSLPSSTELQKPGKLTKYFLRILLFRDFSDFVGKRDKEIKGIFGHPPVRGHDKGHGWYDIS